MQAEMPAVLVAAALLAADVESCARAAVAKAKRAMGANFILRLESLDFCSERRVQQEDEDMDRSARRTRF